MQIAEFLLERYFAKWEFAVRHVLGASDVEPYSLDELLTLADEDTLRRWNSLSLGYTESLGLPVLRHEISQIYDRASADDVITFAGAEEGIYIAMHALLTAGDHAVVIWPSYQSLHEVARSIGASVTLVPLDPCDWSLDIDAVESAMRPNTRVVVANFPHNPTGSQLSIDQLKALVAIAERHGAHFLSDEVYRLLEHDGQPLPAAVDCSERALSLGVMSKSFALAGLRIGWIATRDRMLSARLASLKDYTTICNSAPSEILALIALRAKDRVIARSRAIVRENLETLDAFFSRNADLFAWVRPRAGSVCFPALRRGDVDEFAAALVEREGVLIVPGSQFGFPGNHFRLGYGRRDMGEAVARLEAFAHAY
jgi:aspartate/methionine/tyrosine aminotransferase